MNANGAMLKGWQEIDGYKYYFSVVNGFMRTGRVTIGGVLYDFAEDGKLIGEVVTTSSVNEFPSTEEPAAEEPAAEELNQAA